MRPNPDPDLSYTYFPPELVIASLRKWRNWQTRKPQELVTHKVVGVQIPPSAPSIKALATGIN